jgi:hypothetical protein
MRPSAAAGPDHDPTNSLWPRPHLCSFVERGDLRLARRRCSHDRILVLIRGGPRSRPRPAHDCARSPWRFVPLCRRHGSRGPVLRPPKSAKPSPRGYPHVGPPNPHPPAGEPAHVAPAPAPHRLMEFNRAEDAIAEGRLGVEQALPMIGRLIRHDFHRDRVAEIRPITPQPRRYFAASCRSGR